MKKLIIAMLAFSFNLLLNAQSDSAKPAVSYSGYIETYYNYDFSQPADHNRSSFIYSYNRHNEINLNLGYIKTAYAKGNLRGNLALMTGTYTNANLAAEPGVLKNIFEANVGVKISKKHNLWADAGIFSSHIGFESAIGKDCWNLTRSILADNSPYYESGAKVTYTSKNEKWTLTGLVLNGWQHIQRPNGNNTPAFGHQLQYKPSSKVTLNSSSFIGSDKPDSARQMRYFHNFYGQFQVTSKLGLIVGFDIGMEQKAKDTSAYNTWYSPVLIARYVFTKKAAVAARAEYYQDKNGVIIPTGTANGFQTFGYSVNFDYAINENALWRIEGRAFNSKDNIFSLNGSPSAQNYFITTAIAISF